MSCEVRGEMHQSWYLYSVHKYATDSLVTTVNDDVKSYFMLHDNNINDIYNLLFPL